MPGLLRRLLPGVVLPLLLLAGAPAHASGTHPTRDAQPHEQRQLDRPVLTRSSTVTGATRGGPTTVTSAPSPYSARGHDRLRGTSLAISLGGCGWFQVCVYLSRSEQRVAFTGGVGGVAAILCLAGPAACVLAAAGGAAVVQYIVGERGGICPTSAPRLRLNLTTGAFGNFQPRCVD